MFKSILNDMKKIIGNDGGFWNLLVPALGAVAGGLQANEQKKDVRRQNRAQAEITRYSPWTGMKGQMQAEPSAVGGALQGGMMGAMAANQMGMFDKAGVKPPTGKPPVPQQEVSQSVSTMSSAPVVQQPQQGVSLMRPQGGNPTADYVEGLAQNQNPWGRLY